MKTKNIPGFTAEASLYRTSNRHRRLTFDRAPIKSILIPQRHPDDPNPHATCISDCRDLHPDWPARACGDYCRDPGAPPPPPPDPTNRDLSIAGCWSFWAACKVNPFAFGCDAIRDKCLADIRR